MRSCLTSGGWILPPTVPSWPVNWRIWLVYQKFQHSPWVSRVTSVTWAGQLPTNKSHTQWSFSHYCPLGACFCLRLGRGYPTEGRMLFPSFTPNLHQSLREPKFSRKTEVLGCPKSLFGLFSKMSWKNLNRLLGQPRRRYQVGPWKQVPSGRTSWSNEPVLRLCSYQPHVATERVQRDQCRWVPFHLFINAFLWSRGAAVLPTPLENAGHKARYLCFTPSPWLILRLFVLSPGHIVGAQ